ncbi:hypothetical protein K1719_019627 [Acacia pycnantha]|nr:hypothetical protein K1719_019627 [Acacia pycnantha]
MRLPASCQGKKNSGRWNCGLLFGCNIVGEIQSIGAGAGVPFNNPSVSFMENFHITLADTSATSASRYFISTDGVLNARARVLRGGSTINAGFYTRASSRFIEKVGWDAKVVNKSYPWVEKQIVYRPKIAPRQRAVRDGLLDVGVSLFNDFTFDHVHSTKVVGTIFDRFGCRHSAAELLASADPRKLSVLTYATGHKNDSDATANSERSCSTQLIDGDGIFNVEGMERFMKEVKLGECGLSYAVVSIMGPQSSGKSTLLNKLFGTDFKEMDASKGRSKTTKGIWMAKCAGIEPFTLVMDLEGTDGGDRGEDDTAFEKQSALFALAVSDIVLINMWCQEIDLQKAANKPLLKTVFQVMKRLSKPRKTTLLFVIRDKTKTPLKKLEPVLREDIQKMWDSPKPQAHMESPLSEFFKVEVVALSSFEDKEEQFKEQAAELRQRFQHSIAPGGLAGDRRGVVPASDFSLRAQQIWKIIKENKDLDLPAPKVMVATVRCEEIANEKYAAFIANEEWHELEEAVKSGPVPGFGKRLSSILDSCLSEYDSEVTYFDEGVRSAKQKKLKEKLLQHVQPAFQTVLRQLRHKRSGIMEKYKEALDRALKGGEAFSAASNGCTESFTAQFGKDCADVVIEQADWDASKPREKLHRDIDAYVASVRAAKLSEITSSCQEKLKDDLSGPIEELLDGANSDTWPAIRNLLKRETESAVSSFSTALSGFDMDEQTRRNMITSLEDYAKGVVEAKAREESARVLIHMKDRFTMSFSHDSDSMPRVWTGKEDIRAITKTARSASLKLLSVMVAIRLDANSDNIEKTLAAALLDPPSSEKDRSIATVDPLASSSWAEIPSSKTLITPIQCKKLWRQFKTETEYSVTQAISAQEAHNRSNSWLPPPWAIVALLVLGFDEFMTVLRNLSYFGVVFIGFLVGNALWVQLDISNEFRQGMLPGMISLSAKFLPTVLSVIRKLAEQAHNPPPTNNDPQRKPSETNQNSVTASSNTESSSASSNLNSLGKGPKYE